MPREIPAQASGNMLNKMGIEMSFILGTQFGVFSTKETAGAKGIIASLSSCTVERKADSMGSCGNVSVTLADHDGQVKLAMDVTDMEGSRATLWQRFEGANGEDNQIIMLKGRVRGPIQWEEGSRSVSFEIESHIWSDQIGFAPTAEDFPDLNPDIFGTPWPLLFGKVYHVPAVHVKKRPAGTLHTNIRLTADPGYRLAPDGSNLFLDIANIAVNSELEGGTENNKIFVKGGESFPQDTPISIIIEGVIFKGQMSGEVFSVTNSNASKYTDLEVDSRPASDKDFKNSSVLWLKKDSKGQYPNILNHHCYFRTAPGFTWYNYCVKQSNAKCWFRTKFISPVEDEPQVFMGPTNKAKGKEVWMGSGKVIKEVYGISRNGVKADLETFIAGFRESVKRSAIFTSKSSWGAAVAALKTLFASSKGFWRADADTEVRIWNGDPDIYVFSAIPCTEVLGVYGKQLIRVDGGKTKKILKAIPKGYYTEQLTSNYPINDSAASALLFQTPLSDYTTEDGQAEWEDTIYVSATSSIEANPVEVIRWALTLYTDLKIGKSFDTVKTKIAGVPCNFAHFDRTDAIRFSEEVAWQARCALITDSGKAELVFLAEKPIASFEFNVTNTEFRTLKMGLTPIDEIETRFIGTWTPNYEDAGQPDRHTESDTLRLKHIVRGINAANDHQTRTATNYQLYQENVDIYGERTVEWRFSIYDNPKAVDGALAFWGHRKANSWKLVELNGFHDSMGLTVFDGVNLNLPGIPITRGVVESCSFDPKEKVVSYRIWLPVRASHIADDAKAWQV